jgi:hypothetical protein
MEKPFSELRERLLKAGVAPRHVRRYLRELADHLADLTAEGECAGLGRSSAETAALHRLGGMDELARAMIEQRQFQAWSVRAPWAAFGVAPVALLAATWFVALLILLSGWKAFLPGSETPFVRVDGFASFYFGSGRLIYYIAPVLVGWCIGLMAVRQRLKTLWPAVGMVLVALFGATSHVQASLAEVPGGLGHIRMNFILGSSVQAITGELVHTLVILSLGALPLLVWGLQRTRSHAD